MPAFGGTPLQVTTIDRAHGEGTAGYVQALPGGHFLYGVVSYGVVSTDPQKAGIYAATLAKPAERVRLLANAIDVRYASGVDGEDYLLWIRDRTLFAQPFNTEKLQLIGEPRLLADPVAMASSGGRSLLYGSSIGLRQFKWLDRKGNDVGLLGEIGAWAFSRISPDGGRVATTRADGLRGVWLLETRRGVANRLTTSISPLSPVWSPDEKTILFSRFAIYRIGVDGTGIEERVTQSPNVQSVSDWSRDGRFVVYSEVAPDTGRDLWVLPVTSEGRPSPGAKPWPFVREPFDQQTARFSPDTHWVAYQSDESGQFEIYVRSFPEPREKIRISTGGGTYPQWGSGGRELFYQSRDGKLMVVTLTTTASLEASLPRQLFALPAFVPGPNPYEATPDGQRFLIPEPAASPEPLNVIVNWPALLKKGAPAP